MREDWKGQEVWEKENKEVKAGKEGRNRNQVIQKVRPRVKDR